jgi:ABC-type dipeptide/oligopeptide/nickel transport system permease subunit
VVAASLGTVLSSAPSPATTAVPSTASSTFILMNAFMSFPGILIAYRFCRLPRPGHFQPGVCAFARRLVGYARLVRAQILAAREKELRLKPPVPSEPPTVVSCLRHILPTSFNL